VSKSLEMATITCAECGLFGHLEREGNQISASIDDAFAKHCKSPEPGSVLRCPHLDEACRAAVPHLKEQSVH
jgi:hypothetical protein